MVRCEGCGEDIGTKEEIMEDMVEAHKVERNNTVEILCEACYHEQPLGSLREDYEAESFEATEWIGFCPECNKWRTKEMSVKIDSKINTTGWSIPEKLLGKRLCKKSQRFGKIRQSGDTFTGYGSRPFDNSYCGTPLTRVKNAETSGQWEIGEQLDEAESFEAQAPRGHKMMTEALGKKIPPLYSQDGKGDEAIVYAHYFNPYGIGEWWILEWDGKDEMFGYADLGFPELGYISLSELENVSIGGMELPIERDLHWQEKTLGEVKKSKSFSAPTKGIDTFTQPFEESSLDSGTVKSIVVGLGIGALALFGYNKWK